MKIQTEIVKDLAFKYHAGQYIRDGILYIQHPELVAYYLTLAGEEDDVIACAWGHDLLENTAIMEKDFREAGVNETVITNIKVLTKNKGEYYSRYLKNISGYPIAKKVKIIDIFCHLTDSPTNKQKDKYFLALVYFGAGLVIKE